MVFEYVNLVGPAPCPRRGNRGPRASEHARGHGSRLTRCYT
ncbi:hypothetical protein FRACA_610007 [Frankia canadensis]|uniref:Uncharacterized protein n=1 Tax=Frankia canadensis TaxID=1836972 RepID=A0A2I2KZN4_9ACTN|nr:hypothetical protein FRACA_610007 [Frankia canadensis]SOU58416.1 hypothetical protein FRACA_610007 [Frankia canadensis]